jgi:hypothetical protein
MGVSKGMEIKHDPQAKMNYSASIFECVRGYHISGMIVFLKRRLNELHLDVKGSYSH